MDVAYEMIRDGADFEDFGITLTITSADNIFTGPLTTGPIRATVRVYRRLEPMTIDFSPAGDQIALPGEALSYSVTVNGGKPPYTYSWTASNATVQGGSSENATITYGDGAAGTTNNVSVTVADSTGNAPQSASATVRVPKLEFTQDISAPDNYGNKRSSVGLAERTSFTLKPDGLPTATWNASRGGISGASANRARWNAGPNAGSATVKATVGGKEVSADFQVLAPTSYEVTPKLPMPTPGPGYTVLREQWRVLPKHVSFHYVRFWEFDLGSSVQSGYFHPDRWNPGSWKHKPEPPLNPTDEGGIIYDNAGTLEGPLWPVGTPPPAGPKLLDGEKGWPTDDPYIAGQVTFDIRIFYQAEGGSPVVLYRNIPQVMGLSPDGTFTVTKFGLTAPSPP